MLARGLAARVGRLAHRRVASTATPASVVHRIELEPLTAEAFAPFGEICGTLSQAPPSLHVPYRWLWSRSSLALLAELNKTEAQDLVMSRSLRPYSPFAASSSVVAVRSPLAFRTAIRRCSSMTWPRSASS